MAVGDVYRLTVDAIGGGHQFLNTWAFTMRSGADPTDAEAAALAVRFKDYLKSEQSNTITWRSWKLQQLFGGDVVPIRDECRRDGGRVLVGNFTTAVTGGSVGDALPPQCAFVWTISTGLAGRRRRGRTYVFGLPETAQSGGVWQTANLNAYTTALNGLFATYGASGTDPNFLLGVWSERIATGCRPNPTTGRLENVESPRPEDAFNMATGFIARPVVYTQRRRTVGVGR